MPIDYRDPHEKNKDGYPGRLYLLYVLAKNANPKISFLDIWLADRKNAGRMVDNVFTKPFGINSHSDCAHNKILYRPDVSLVFTSNDEKPILVFKNGQLDLTEYNAEMRKRNKPEIAEIDAGKQALAIEKEQFHTSDNNHNDYTIRLKKIQDMLVHHDYKLGEGVLFSGGRRTGGGFGGLVMSTGAAKIYDEIEKILNESKNTDHLSYERYKVFEDKIKPILEKRSKATGYSLFAKGGQRDQSTVDLYAQIGDVLRGGVPKKDIEEIQIHFGGKKND